MILSTLLGEALCYLTAAPPPVTGRCFDRLRSLCTDAVSCEVCAGHNQAVLRAAACTSSSVAAYCNASEGLPAAFDCPELGPGVGLHTGGGELELFSPTFRAQFDQTSGAGLALIDAATNQYISQKASRGGCLWGLSFSDNSFHGSCGAPTPPHWSWNSSSCDLTLAWRGGGSSSSCAPAVTVTLWPMLSPSESLAADTTKPQMVLGVKLSLSLPETCSKTATQLIHYPADLALDRAAMQSALVPKLPGVVLHRGFFDAGLTWGSTYPGDGMFADFMALQTVGGGAIAVYSPPLAPADGSSRAPVYLGLMSASTSDLFLHRAVMISLTAGDGGGSSGPSVYTAPTVFLLLNRSFDQASASLARATASSSSSSPPSLKAKLHAKLGPKRFLDFLSAPLLLIDAKEAGVTFREYNRTLLSLLQAPALLHPAAYEPRGFDHDYPDFLPPATEFGTTQEFRAAVASAQARGHFVMPVSS